MFLTSSVIHVPRVFRAIRRKKNPVVHIHGTGLFQVAIFLLIMSLRIPLVWTLHGITEKETFHEFQRNRSFGNFLRFLIYTLAERFLLYFAPAIIVDTQYVYDAISAATKNVHIIPQGIFSDEYTDRVERSNPPIILSLGVLVPRKGHHLMVESFALIKASHINAQLVIAGASKKPDYVLSLRNRIHELGLGDSVRIATNLHRNEIIALLMQAHIFALHSKEESQGIALCEALAAGLPIVASNVGGIPFVVNDQKSGFLVSYNDVKGFADCLARLLVNRDLYSEMSLNARVASQRFDWGHIADEVILVYKAALNKR